MDLTTMRSAVRRRTGMLSDDQLGADADLTALINDAIHYLEIESPSGWPWQKYRDDFVTVAGTQEYAFTTIDSSNTISRIGSLRLIVDSNYEYELTQMSYPDLVTFYSSTNQSTPEAFAVSGRAVILRPVPSAVWTIRFAATKAEPDLSANDDEPLMPAMFHNAIIEQACYLWYRRSGNDNSAQVAKAELTHLIAKMMAYSRETAGPSRIRDVRETSGLSF